MFYSTADDDHGAAESFCFPASLNQHCTLNQNINLKGKPGKVK